MFVVIFCRLWALGRGQTASSDVYEAMAAGAGGARAMAAARRRMQRDALAAAAAAGAGAGVSGDSASRAAGGHRDEHRRNRPHHRSQPSDSSSCALSGSDDGSDNDGPIPVSAAPLRSQQHHSNAASAAPSAVPAAAAASASYLESSADAAARRLRTAMRNTTASLRKELREQVAAQADAHRSASHTPRQQLHQRPSSTFPLAAPDELPPPLPLLSGLRGNTFAHRSPPRIGFGDAAFPLLPTPVHHLVQPSAPEPLRAMPALDRADLVQRLRQYDAARADPEVALSALFLNRLVYDCTAAPVFARRWIVPRERRGERCRCANCSLMHQTPEKNHKASLHPTDSDVSLLGRSSSLQGSGPDLSCVRGGCYSAELRSFYTPASPADSTLVFESRFESGNLRTAFQVSSHEYDLAIRPDFNTTHHTQWFYFSVRNTRAGAAAGAAAAAVAGAGAAAAAGALYKFNIINCTKPGSLFNEGMQPVMYSTIASSAAAAAAAAATQPPSDPFAIPLSSSVSSSGAPASAPAGWYRTGSNIVYYPNHLVRGSSRQSHYSSLSFTLQFPHDHDLVYVAFAVPYTYTDLNRDLEAIESDPARSRWMRRRILCRTLAGNEVDVLTITDFAGTNRSGGPMSHRAAAGAGAQASSGPHAIHASHAAHAAQAAAEEAIRSRPGIFFSARVHPGESNSSWIMRGLLDFLTGASVEAQRLRQSFVFKLCPMINVDGVVVGNYRCSLAGVDLNRQWRLPSPVTHPEIAQLKALLTRMQRRPGGVRLAIDIHGHSRKQCIFMYGCPALPPPAVATAAAGSNAASSEDAARAAPPPPPAAVAVSSKKRSKAAAATAAAAELNPNRFLERVFPRLLARETIAAAAANQARAQAEAAQAQADVTGSAADIAAAASLASASATAAESAARLASRATGFSFSNCSFSISRGKESTARVVLYRELGIANSYTLEASFAGCNQGALKGLQFSVEHLQSMGRALCETLLDFTNPLVFEATRNVLQTAGVAATAATDKAQEDDSDDSSDSPDEYAPPTSMLPVARSGGGSTNSPRKKRVKKISKKLAAQRRMEEKLARLQSGAPTTTAATADVGSRARASAALAAAALPLKDVNGVAPSALNSTSSFSSTSREAADRLRSMWRSTTGLPSTAEAEAAAAAAAATAASMAAIAEEQERRRLLKQRRMAAAHQKRQAILNAAAEVDGPIRRREASPSPSVNSSSYAPSASAFAAGIGASGYFRMPQAHAAPAVRPTAALMALSLPVEDYSASPHLVDQRSASPVYASGDESSPSPPHATSSASPLLQCVNRSGEWIDAAMSSLPAAAVGAAAHHHQPHQGHIRGASFGSAAAAAAASRARPKSAYGALLRAKPPPESAFEAEQRERLSAARPSSATLLSKARRASASHPAPPPIASSPSPPLASPTSIPSPLASSAPAVQWDELLKSSREGSAESVEHRRAHQARAEQLDRLRREHERTAERLSTIIYTQQTHKRGSGSGSGSFSEDSFTALAAATSLVSVSNGMSASSASQTAPSRLSLRHASSGSGAAPSRSPTSSHSGGSGLGGWAGGLRGSASSATSANATAATANGLAPSGIVGQSLRGSSNNANAGSALAFSVTAAPRSTSMLANRR